MEDFSIGVMVLLFVVVIIVIIVIQTVFNMLMPEIFGIKQITFLQTIGLLFLSNVFFNCSSNISKMYYLDKISK